jgi:hypothetical protein
MRPLRTRFRWGFGAEHLNRARNGKSPDHYAKGTPSPYPLRGQALTACRRVVSGSVSSPWWGFFPSFARATGFTIGRQGVLSLAGWAPQIQAEFHVFGPTQVPDTMRRAILVAYGTFTLYGGPFRTLLLKTAFVTPMSGPTTPPGVPDGLGYSAFARRYLRSRGFFPFLQVLRCFSSPGSPRTPMDSGHAGLGYPGIKARLTAPPGLSQSSTPFFAS